MSDDRWTGSLSRQTRNAFARRSCANNPVAMTMADRSGLKLVGFIFATVTVAVMLTAAMVVTTAHPRLEAWSGKPPLEPDPPEREGEALKEP